MLLFHASIARPSYAESSNHHELGYLKRHPLLVFQHLFLILLSRRLHIFNVLLLKSVDGNRVQAEKRLVGVLDQNILALVHSEDHVDNGTDDTPTVVKVECHLRGKLARLVGEHTKNDVVVVVLGVGTGNETVTVLDLRKYKAYRNTYPSFMVSALARILCTAHRASLQELFFISVAKTAPLWLANLDLQSKAPPEP
jgi:hypothetical protein